MIYILHGENLTGIRNFILKLSDDNNIKVRHDLSIDSVEPSDVLDYVSSFDMFSSSTLITLDVSKMGRMNVTKYVEVLGKIPPEIIFIIFSSKELSKANTFIKSALKLGARVMPFKKVSMSNIFKFCDAVFDKNRKLSYKELRNLLLDGEDAVYLLVMLTSALRNIAYAKFNSKEFDKVPPFIKSKIRNSAAKFSEEDICFLYEKFYSYDIGLKTGTVSPEVLPVLAIEAVFKLQA